MSPALAGRFSTTVPPGKPGVYLFGFILYGTLCFLDLGDCLLSQVREVFSYYVFKYVLSLFLFLFSFWDPYNVNISALDVVSEVS